MSRSVTGRTAGLVIEINCATFGASDDMSCYFNAARRAHGRFVAYLTTALGTFDNCHNRICLLIYVIGVGILSLAIGDYP